MGEPCILKDHTIMSALKIVVSFQIELKVMDLLYIKMELDNSACVPILKPP